MQQDDRHHGIDAKIGLSILYVAIGGHKATIVPFLHFGFGKEYPGKDGLVGAALLIGFGVFGQQPALLAYLGVWLVMLALRKIDAARMAKNGWRQHSRYDGFPVLSRMFKMKESYAKPLEVVLCFALGIGLACMADKYHWEWMYALAAWVGCGSVSLLVMHGISNVLERRRAQAMIDAQIEQEQLAERVREMNGQQ